MVTITGFTAARMLAMEAATIVSGAISGDNLILTKHDSSTVNAGNVRGPQGIQGVGLQSQSNINRIINGDFSVNQRGFSSITESGNFGHDRWKMLCTGGTTTYSAQTAALGLLPESNQNYARMVTTGQSTTGHFAKIQQHIEDVRTLSGKSATVSFWAWAGSGTPKIAVEYTQSFGTGGSSPVAIYAGQVTLSTTPTRYSVTVSLPSVSGKTITSDSCLIMQLWTSAGSSFNSETGSLGIQNTTINIWGVQAEEGTSATAFKQESYADTLRACQRYYEYRAFGISTGQNVMAVCYNSAAQPVGHVAWIVQKRAIPTIIFPSNGSGRFISTAALATNQTFQTASVSLEGIDIVTVNNHPAGAGWFDGFSLTASSEF